MICVVVGGREVAVVEAGLEFGRDVPRCPVEVGRLSARTWIDEAISWREAAWWNLNVLCVYLQKDGYFDSAIALDN